MYPYKDIIEQIRLNRKKKGLTQEELAEMAGLKQTSLARIENRRMSPTVNMLNRILDALGMVLTLEPYQKIDRHLIVCLDMYGCPNRCRHCWLGDLPNVTPPSGCDEHLVSSLKSYFRDVTFYSWVREPDFTPDYKARWEKDNEISSIKPIRFELASFYRIVRDEAYTPWLKKIGTRKVQLTFFGLKEKTDAYVGRVGAYEELLKATKILKENGITPRWQIFINQDNVGEIKHLINIGKKMEVPEIFVHEGSCEGRNRDLYPIRINKSEIPESVKPYYLGYSSLLSEKECLALLKDDPSHFVCHNDEDITIYVDGDLNVYFNFTNPSPAWKIGNLKEDDIDSIVKRIMVEDVPANILAKSITLGELAERYGDKDSDKAFAIDDYKMYLLNRYLDEKYNQSKIAEEVLKRTIE